MWPNYLQAKVLYEWVFLGLRPSLLKDKRSVVHWSLVIFWCLFVSKTTPNNDVKPLSLIVLTENGEPVNNQHNEYNPPRWYHNIVRHLFVDKHQTIRRLGQFNCSYFKRNIICSILHGWPVSMTLYCVNCWESGVQ